MSGTVSNLPSRDAGFVGRADSLDQIRTGLAARGRVVVHGPAGAGTTRLALEHAHRHATDYDVIWLVAAGHDDLVGGHLAEAAHAAGLVEADVTIPAAIQAVHAEMTGGARWLLIFDDANGGLDGRLPPRGGHVIITSRRAGWDSVAAPVEVGFFRREESAGLLRQRTGSLSPAEADTLADALGDRPLAVAQAAALIRLSPQEPLPFQTAAPAQAATSRPDPNPPTAAPISNQRQTDPPTTTGRPGTNPSAASATRIAIDRLESDRPAAAQLLCLCSVLGTEPIPADLFTRSLDRLPGPLGEIAPTGFSALVQALRAHGLAEGGQTHPLVREVVRDQLGDAAARVCREYAGILVAAAVPADVEDPATWPRWTALAPHLLAADPAASTNPALRAAAGRLVRYLLRRAEPRPALSIAATLHGSWRRLLGPDHPHTLAAATWRAHALLTLGQVREAQDLTTDTAARCRAVLGDDHPDTLRALGDHAAVVTALGDYAAGRDLHRSIRTRRAEILGPDHPDTLRSALGLTRCLNLLGEPAAALIVGEDAFARARRILGPDHPDTLHAATEPAVSLAALGRDDEARRWCEDAHTRCRRVFGDDHPQTLAAAHCLAAVLHGAGARTEGRRMHQDILARRTAVLGPDHPDTLRSAFAVAVALLATGAVLPARKLIDETLARLVGVLGPDHPLTRNVRERQRQARQLMGGLPRRKKPAPRKGRRS
jgi:hypothetical protein